MANQSGTATDIQQGGNPDRDSPRGEGAQLTPVPPSGIQLRNLDGIGVERGGAGGTLRAALTDDDVARDHDVQKQALAVGHVHQVPHDLWMHKDAHTRMQ